jgi:NAD(P)-dependent dehydrogenase (short-subunit alcohol dehydrogenase family)
MTSLETTNLAPRRILITGCSTGVGQAAALRFARRGDHVFATVRRSADGEALAVAAEGSAGVITPLEMELTSEQSVRAAVATVAASGDLDVLINNAGMPCVGSVEELPLVAWREAMEVNLFGAVRVCQAVIPGMRRRGSGRIINISSSIAAAALPLYGAYCASKFALEAMTEAMRHELLPFGIGVHLLRPGIIVTSFVTKKQRQSEPRLGPDSPYAGRLDTPSPPDLMQTISDADDVAAALAHLADVPSTPFRVTVGEDSRRWCAARSSMDDDTFFAQLTEKGYGF